MRRTLQRLSAVAIGRAHAPGYLADGGGLYLQITAAGSRSWIFRFSLSGRRREMGLGSYPSVTLAAARKLASEGRALLGAGIDPIAARDAVRARQRLADARGVTWDAAVSQFLATHETAWRNPKHRQQWRNTLATYASPVLGALSAGSIGTPEVVKVLDPIWQEKPETAFRVRGRIERVWDWCKVRGYCTGENPARWRGHLDKVFPARAKVRKVKHHAAVPIDRLSTVYARLCKAQGIGAIALRFTILTATRPSETTGARWPELDQRAGIWTIPGERMKSGREHRVTLSREALAILGDLAAVRTSTAARVFPGYRAGKPLSLASLSKALRAAGGGKATVHGTARSTFKDWASERTTFAGEVSEMALAHSIGDKTEAAYRRGELLDKRRALMEAWAKFLRAPAAVGGDVVSIGRHRTRA